MPSARIGSLARSLATWSPRYRVIRLGLVVLAAVAGVTVFAENRVLEGLSLSMSAEGAGPHSLITWTQHPLRSLAERAHELGYSKPLLLLLIFAAIRLGRIAADAWGRNLLSALQIRGRTEFEAEVLEHLQRKNDQFFATRPIAEILNRLSSDIDRALESREASLRLFRLLIMIVGNLYFFVLQDWRLAMAGVLTCCLGALWMEGVARPVAERERTALEKNDRARAQFEDLLRAAPEVQVANLYAQSAQHIRRIQRERVVALIDVARLEASLSAVQGLANLLAITSLFVVMLYFLAAQAPDAGAALVPIIMKALPELFSNASAIVLQRLSLQRSRTSVERLLEFESPLPNDGSTAPIPEVIDRIQLQDVTYQYVAPGGIAQGGITGVSVTFERGRWYSIVGPAGAGKSTLEQVLLGRLQPQSGQVLISGYPIYCYPESQRARWLSVMPQRYALLDASIADNLHFGRATNNRAVTPEDLATLEAAGLGDVCRRKALDLRPAAEEVKGDLGRRILLLRARVQRALDELGLYSAPYSAEHADPDQWIIEQLFKGRCNRGAVVSRLTASRSQGALRSLIRTELGVALIQRGRDTLRELAHLLQVESYTQFSKLSPVELDEPVWQLWRSALPAVHRDFTTRAEAVLLMCVALTSSGRLGDAGPLDASVTNNAKSVGILLTLHAGLWQPFDVAHIHPYLSWRENLVFASVDTRNDRMTARLEQVLLDLIAADGLTDAFTQVGMRFNVGPSGARLSGGQGQLVALCRTLLRDTPVLVLDEPTSALDPVSRQRVANLLRQRRPGRIIITVSHDPAFIRASDEAVVIERGHVTLSGPPAAVSGAFETIDQRLATPMAGTPKALIPSRIA